MIKSNKELVEMFSGDISIANITDCDCWTLVGGELRYKGFEDEYCLERARLVSETQDYKLFEIKDNGGEYYLVACVFGYKTPDEYDDYEYE